MPTTKLDLTNINNIEQTVTATPTASSIPIADGSGKMDDGWLNTEITDPQIYTPNTITQNDWITTILGLYSKDETAVGDNQDMTGGWSDNNNWNGVGKTKTRFLNYISLDQWGANGHFAESIMGATATNSVFGDGKDLRIKFRLKLQNQTGDRSIGLAGSGGTLRGAITTVGICAMFTIDDNVLYAVNADGAGNNNTDISAGIDIEDWHTYEIVIDDGNSIKYYVDGTLKATHTTNLANTGTIKFGAGAVETALNWLLSDITISQEL